MAAYNVAFMPGDTKEKHHSRLSKDQIAEFLTKTELKKWNSNQKKYCTVDVIFLLRSICKKNICLYPETMQRNKQLLKESLQEHLVVYLDYFKWITKQCNNIEFGFYIMWSVMHNSEAVTSE